jgi:hypothetical protein
MSRLRRHLSPALVLACLALLVAVGGTSYAQVALPANSVGTKQLKNGAVVASKVKLRSLLARNFKLGQIPRGPEGARGPQGAQGLPGAAGPAGPSGPAGAKGDSATRLFSTVRNTMSGSGVELGPSSGVATLVKGGTGNYRLTFNQDVNNCAILATPGGNEAEVQDGRAASTTTGPREVTVTTFTDSDTDPDDLDFTVAVFC